MGVTTYVDGGCIRHVQNSALSLTNQVVDEAGAPLDMSASVVTATVSSEREFPAKVTVTGVGSATGDAIFSFTAAQLNLAPGEYVLCTHVDGQRVTKAALILDFNYEAGGVG